MLVNDETSLILKDTFTCDNDRCAQASTTTITRHNQSLCHTEDRYTHCLDTVPPSAVDASTENVYFHFFLLLKHVILSEVEQRVQALCKFLIF